ncbi:MAG: leucine-rich repeat protein [Muribaculaceae bacterium]|nr:leucine-rich repeat protein [Muribaculaceae bacterium]
MRRTALHRILLAVMIMAVLTVPSVRGTEVDGINYELNATARTATVVALDDGRSYEGRVTIPEWVAVSNRSYRVTAIGMHAFYDCQRLKAVIFGDNITRVGYEAFAWCSALQMIKVNSSLAVVESEAFAGCAALEQVVLSDLAAWCKIDFLGITPRCNPLYYAHQMVLKDTYVRTMQVPDGITEVKRYSFAGCNVVAVILPSTVTHVDMLAFKDCSLLRMLNLPETVTTLSSDETFNDAGLCVLENVTLGDGLRVVPDYAFAGCRLLRTLVVGVNVRLVGFRAFKGCVALEELTLPTVLTSIANESFADCSGLLSVTMSGSLTSIGTRAFAGCSSLRSVTMRCHASRLKLLGDGIFDGVNTDRCVLYVPHGQVEAYRRLPQFSIFTTICEEGTPIQGDINGDGEVSVADVTALITILLNPSMASERARQVADINNDGEISIADVTALITLVLAE